MTPFLNKAFAIYFLFNSSIGFILHIEFTQRSLGHTAALFLFITVLIIPLIQWYLIMLDVTTKITTLNRFKYIYILTFGSLISYYISGFMVYDFTYSINFKKTLTPLLIIFIVPIPSSIIGLLIKHCKNKELPHSL